MTQVCIAKKLFIMICANFLLISIFFFSVKKARLRSLPLGFSFLLIKILKIPSRFHVSSVRKSRFFSFSLDLATSMARIKHFESIQFYMHL